MSEVSLLSRLLDLQAASSSAQQTFLRREAYCSAHLHVCHARRQLEIPDLLALQVLPCWPVFKTASSCPRLLNVPRPATRGPKSKETSQGARYAVGECGTGPRQLSGPSTLWTESNELHQGWEMASLTLQAWEERKSSQNDGETNILQGPGYHPQRSELGIADAHCTPAHCG